MSSYYSTLGNQSQTEETNQDPVQTCTQHLINKCDYYLPVHHPCVALQTSMYSTTAYVYVKQYTKRTLLYVYKREENEFKPKKSTFGTDEIDHKTAVSLILTVQ